MRKIALCNTSFKHKRNNPSCDSWDSESNENMQFPSASGMDILIGNKNDLRNTKQMPLE